MNSGCRWYSLEARLASISIARLLSKLDMVGNATNSVRTTTEREPEREPERENVKRNVTILARKQ